MNNYKKVVSLLTIAVLIFFAAACSQPTDSESNNGPSTEQAVVGSVNGYVVDAMTGNGLAGVTVSAQVGNGSVKTTTTSASGYYSIGGLIAGDTILSFYRDGYQTEYLDIADVVTVAADDAVNEDAWNEWEELQILVDEALNGGSGDLGSLTTLNEAGDGTYTYTLADGSTVTISTDENNEALYNYMDSELGLNHVLFTTTAAASVTMNPLVGSISGSIEAFFQYVMGTDEVFDTEEHAAAAGVPVYFSFTDIDGTKTYWPNLDDPQVLTDANGDFLVENLPVGIDLDMELGNFQQALPSDDTVLVSFDGTNLSDINGDAIGPITLYSDDTYMMDIETAVYANHDNVRVISHNIGTINPVLAIDGTIDLTFSDSINTDSFEAFIDINENQIFDEGSDIALVATWDATNTTVSLAGETGYLEYDLDCELYISGYSALGGPIALLDDDYLDVLTEEGLMVEGISFLDANGVVYDTLEYDSTTGDLFYATTVGNETLYAVPGGTIVIDMTKDVDDTTFEVEIFSGSVGGNDLADGDAFLEANKIVEVATGNADTISFEVPSQLVLESPYTFAFRIVGASADALDIYNSDPGNNIEFTYEPVLHPYELHSTLEVDEDNVDTNIDLSILSYGAAAASGQNVEYTDAISLEFNQALTTANSSATLYHWIDDGDGLVEEGELFATASTVTYSADSINGTADTVMTITPDYFLYPDRYYAVQIDVESAQAEYAVTGDDFFMFQAEMTDAFVYPAATDATPITGLVSTNETDDYVAVDSVDGTVTLEWDSLADLYGTADRYVIYTKSSSDTETEYAPLAPVPENNYFANIWAGGLVTTTDAVVTDTVISALTPNVLIYGGSMNYVVTSYTEAGFLAVSNELVIIDEVNPTGAFTTPLTAVDNTAGVVPVVQTIEFQSTEPISNFVITDASSDFTNGINGDQVTIAVNATTAELDGYIAIDVTIPAGASIATGDFVTLAITDTNGRGLDTNRTDGSGASGSITTTIP